MNRTHLRNAVVWILAVCCSLLLSVTAWADESQQTDDVSAESSSRIVVSGAAAARETEKQASEQENLGPAAAVIPEEKTDHDKKGVSLGIFTTTGYCPDECCGGTSGLTYSGTVPQANHTLSADLTRFPIGTKLMIHDVIYTVEDMGSSVKGDWLDIFYDTHEEAMEHGLKQEEVFSVIED